MKAGWLKSVQVGSQILYELDHQKPVFYVIPIQNILSRRPQAGCRRWLQDVVCQLVGFQVGLVPCYVMKWNVEQSIETCSISTHTLGLNLSIMLISLIILYEKLKIMKIIKNKISQNK